MLLTNKKCIVSIFLTTFIVFLTHISGYADITPVQDRTPQIRDAIVAAVPGVNSANDVTAAHLAAIATLEASNKSISALKAGDFDGLTALTTLDLSRNTISDISLLGSLTALTALELSQNAITDISVLKKLTKLRWLFLSHNAISDISPLKNLTALKHLWLGGNAIKDISALEKLTKLKKLWLSRNAISDISVLEKLTPLTALWLDGNAISDVSALEGLISLVSLNLSGNPISDYGPLRRLKTANPDITIDIDIDENDNSAPVFTAGSSTTRSVAENTASGTNIGSAVSATDTDNDTLTYTLGGTDAASFRIVSTSGQLRTNAALDYETKSSYSVTVSVSDSNGGSDSIPVTISVTNVNEAPNFASSTATRSIAENTASGTNIGTAITATDVDTGDTPTYTLGGTDASSFSIVSTSGQLRTNAALNYETKSSYSVTVTARDAGNLSDTISVTISITDVNEAPNFASSTATRSIAENTASGQNIGAAVAATDVDGDTLSYTLGGTDASSFSIVSTSGQLRTSAALDRETKASYSVTVTASDGSLSDTTTVTISVTNVNEAPNFASSTATRSIAENTASGQNIGTALTATDPDGDTLSYTLGGTDASSFSIVSNSGQLRTSAALDRETKASYSVTVTASDGSLSDTTTVTINVTNVNEAPVFTEGSTATRSIAENTTSGTNIGAAVAATDVDGDTLSYTLGGTDASSFSIVSTSGQLRTSAALDRETKASYSVTVTASDGSLSDTTTVTINVTNVNEAPTFATTTATRSVAENTAANQNIGAAFTATDVDSGTTLTYSIPTTGDAAAFSIVSNTGQLKTKNTLNYEVKNAYTVVVTASDGSLTDTITVTISVTNVNETPTFATGTTISSISATKGTAITSVTLPAATDPDANTTITYTVTPTLPAGLTFTPSTRILSGTPTAVSASATYTYTASDSNLSDTLTFTIQVNAPANNAPTFTDGTSTTRSVAENTASGQNIGSAVGATDTDNDTLSYTLGGTDAASFSIVSTTGQLQTNTALNYESKSSYSVSVSVSDNNGGSDSIAVTINVTNVNEAPSFASTTATRSIAENTAANTNIGAAVAATDVDGNTLSYTLGGTDASSFSIVSTSGQLRTSAALDRETKASYSVTVTASDGSLSDTTTVTINVTNVNEAPNFASSTATRSIAENTASGQNIGTAVAATDPDGNTLSYTLGGTDASSFSIVSTSGQLRTSAALDRETKASYSVTVTASDGSLSDTITVTINVTNVNEAPNFASTTATRSIAENTVSGRNIGTAVAATDVDHTSLTYTLGGTDASSFSIVSTSGQLRTSAALDRETKASYSVTVTARDAGNLSDTITVTINVTNVNEAPSFASTTATRSIAENTVSGRNIGTAVAATDVDHTSLTYTLGGTDASSFSIVSTSGQLRTSAALDRETKASYSVTVTARDAGNLSDTITVTINVTNVNEAPSFASTTATRSIAENTVSGRNIGTAVAATDVDHTSLTYSLGGTDASSFSIVSTSGQLRTSAALDRETKASYSVTVTARDAGNLSDTITVTINVTNVNEAPSFASTTATRSIAENTVSGRNIGTAVSATDVDGNTLTYSLGGTDASSFSIVSTSGQLRTSAALDRETKASYSVTVTARDAGNLSDTITVTINVTNVNEAPSFATTTATRSVAENTATNQNIGTALTATDVDSGTTLTYSIATTGDAAAFSIVSNTGQLKTKNTLNYEVKNAYTVVVTASDGSLTDTITVTISVTNVNEAPTFATTTATRSVAENTATNQNIGTALTATDVDSGTTLTYSIPTTGDAAAFSIVSNTGQLKTKNALNHETKASYTVIVTASDGTLSDTITVTISVTNVNEAPSFSTSGRVTLSVAENTAANTNIGTPFQATDPDSGDTVTYSLQRADKTSFRIDANTGQLKTHAALDYETKNSYSNLAVRAADSGGLVSSVLVTVNVTNVNDNSPVFTEGASTTRSIAENTDFGTNIGTPVAATDADNDTLSYTLGGTNASSFYIIGTSGQLRTGSVALDYETKSSYSVTVNVSDGNGGSDSIAVTINVTDVDESPANSAPTFTDGTSTTRTVAENTALGTYVGSAVAATVANNATLTYTLSGADAASFSIGSASGQIQTNAAMDYEVKNSYTVTVDVSGSNGGSDSITVTINVTDEAESPIAPPLSDRTPQVRAAIVAAAPGVSNVADVTVAHLAAIASLNLSNRSIRSLKTGDFNGLTGMGALDLHLNSISDISALSGLTQLRHLDLGFNSISDISALSGMTSMVNLSLLNNSISDISALSGMTLMTSLGLSNNSISDISALSGMTLIDTLNLTNNNVTDVSALSGMTSLFILSVAGNPISDYGPLRTLKAANPNARLDISLNNNPPVFTEGTSATRSIAENTASGTNIGTAVAATDADNHTLRYSLGGTDAASFSIVSTSGQLRTNAALDYETKSSYAVTITVSDGNNGGDSISVTINVTDVVEHDPVFTDGDTTTRSVAENSGRGTNVGTPVAATDANTGDTLTYTLGGTDAASFSIVSTSGQLRTNATLDYETKSSYTVTVDVSDGTGGSDSITVTINVTDVEESTITPVKDRTTQVRDAIVAAVSGVSNADDVTEAHLAAITELNLGSKSITTLKAGDFSGLTGLETLYLDSESPSDTHKNSISDISPLEGLTTLTRLNLLYNSVSDISALSGMTSMSQLNLDNNSVSDISALSGMTSMTILSMKNNNVTDVSPLSGMTTMFILSVAGNPISDYATLRTLQAHSLWVLDISLNNNPPTFTDGATTTRSVAENTAAGQNIGSAVSATDANNHTLTYSLGGTDADSFSIVSTSGQLQTKAALDYETKNSYTVTVTAYDGNNGGDRITVTINVTDVAAAAPVVLTPPAPVLPNTTELLTNFPNPFNPETWIPYQLAKPADVTLTIYDIRGRIVRTLRLGHQPAGFYQNRSKAAHWDGRNHLGEKVATGVYFYTLKAGDYMATRKLLIRK